MLSGGAERDQLYFVDTQGCADSFLLTRGFLNI